MPFTLPNIYTHKNAKFYPLIPIVLMFISIYLSQGIVLDSSLSGGSQITLQTNSTLSSGQAAALISSKLHVPSPGVVVSSGSISITLPANASISKAEFDQVSFFNYNSNYSAALVNYTNYQIALQHSPGNVSLQKNLSIASMVMNQSLRGMVTSLTSELADLKPFIGTQSFNASDVSNMSAVSSGAYQKAQAVYQNTTISQLHSIFNFSTYSYQQVTQLQSQYFLNQLKTIIIIAFILIAIVVFIIFRSIIPSIAVIFGAANDMIIALGAMALFHIPLGIASIGGLLMLLGYAIDTDVLTSIRILKRHEGTPEERAYNSMKTGMTMTMTAIVSFAVLFIVSIIVYVPTYYEISGVVLCGLVGDLATTWLGNANIILAYVKDRHFISNFFRRLGKHEQVP